MLELLISFLYVGLFSIGGGYATLPLIQEQIVELHGWLSYKEITDIRAVAKELGYSYTYLAHVFKEKMDMTIGTYIIHKKMEEAKELLRTGRMNVSQVAERLNYMSVQSFSNSFKKVNGISPAEFISGRQKRPKD